MNRLFFTKLLFLFSLFIIQNTQANVCGSDFQNFNPTTSGMGYLSVQSTQTLPPCVWNLGAYINYTRNTLTYGATDSQNTPDGTKRRDQIVSGEALLGVGLTDRWDIGFSVPAILLQDVKDNYYVTHFESRGITEFRANTKYRFYETEYFKSAFIFSINKNLIEDNPFSGKDPGLTFNYELALESHIKDWWFSLNLGYRDRNPGEKVQAQNQPFNPIDDQFIYSLGLTTPIQYFNSDVVFEIFGAKAKSLSQDTDRNVNVLEGLIGFKKTVFSSSMLSYGIGRQLTDSLGGPDLRVLVGFQTTFDMDCKKKSETIAPIAETDEPVNASSVNQPKIPITPPDNITQIEILFDSNSDRINKIDTKMLDRFISLVKKEGFKTLVVEGHTDSIGNAEYNKDLSQRRAESVKKYLIQQYQINSDQLIPKGYGEEQPVANNTTQAGRQKNRRVEFKVWK